MILNNDSFSFSQWPMSHFHFWDPIGFCRLSPKQNSWLLSLTLNSSCLIFPTSVNCITFQPVVVVIVDVLVAKSRPTLLQTHGLQPPRLFCPWDFPGKNTGVGYHFLPQGIVPGQWSNPRLLHQQADSLPLSHQRSPSDHLRWLKFWQSSLIIHFFLYQCSVYQKIVLTVPKQ